MNKTQQEVFELQRIDPISEAEKIMGESYKANDEVRALGLLLQMQKSDTLRKKLNSIGDTCFSETVESYITKVCKGGFEVVYKEPFKRLDKQLNIEIEECLYVLFNKQIGALIHFDSFTWGPKSKPGVNGGKVYYNWSLNDMKSRGGLTSSGSFLFDKIEDRLVLLNEDLSTRYIIEQYPKSLKWDRSNVTWEVFQQLCKPIEEKQKQLIDEALANNKRIVWIGDHDCREGVLTNLQALLDNGILLPKWQACQFTWIINYTEYEKSNENWNEWSKQMIELTKERINKMPQEVRDCINNTYREGQ